MKKETEEQGVEVFGTKEIAVEQFMGGSDKSLMLLSNYDLAKENLEALKNKHELRVEELVLVEKLSASELKELNAIRGELREPRYLVQKIEKNNTSVFESYKKVDKANLKFLIDINKLLEDKADDKIKLEEDRKKNEKAEAERLERERESNLRKSIDDFESDSYKIIQSTTIADVDLNKSMLDALVNEEFDYEEFDILFEQARMRVQNAWHLKCNDIQEKEEQRLRNVELEEQAAKAKILFELQAERLTQIMPYVAFGEPVDLARLSELDDDVYKFVYNDKKELLDDYLKKQQELEKTALTKLEDEKEVVYQIRKNRLLELGMIYSDEHDTLFIDEDSEYILIKEDVLDYTALEFEGTFSEVKNIIQSAKEKVEQDKVFEIRKSRLLEIGFKFLESQHRFLYDNENISISKLLESVFDADDNKFESIITDAKLSIEKAKLDADELKKQKAKDLELAKSDAERLKKENKARVKKYANDKKAISEFIDSLEFQNLVPELENEDMQELLDSTLDYIKNLKPELQLSLKNF